MTFYSADMEGDTTIGDILRDRRIQQGMALEAVADETKISPKHLVAMESGDLAALPAEVYARGFYTMYARLLSLDPVEVLEMYGRERKKLPKSITISTPPPNRLAQNMADLAERPTSLPSSYFGLVIFLFLLFGAFLCWYFGWNPASFLSGKLRSLDDSQPIEQVKNDRNKPYPTVSVMPGTRSPSSSQSLDLFSPSTVTAATTQPEEASTNQQSSPMQLKYTVNATFAEDTALSLQIDNQAQQTITCKKGATTTWRAGEKLTLLLPAETHARLSLNDMPVQLPPAVNNKIKLTIPENNLR